MSVDKVDLGDPSGEAQRGQDSVVAFMALVNQATTVVTSSYADGREELRTQVEAFREKINPGDVFMGNLGQFYDQFEEDLVQEAVGAILKGDYPCLHSEAHEIKSLQDILYLERLTIGGGVPRDTRPAGELIDELYDSVTYVETALDASGKNGPSHRRIPGVSQVGEELANIFETLCVVATDLGVNLGDAISKKVAYTRYERLSKIQGTKTKPVPELIREYRSEVVSDEGPELEIGG